MKDRWNVRKIKSRLTNVARALRKSGNISQDKLWHALRNRNLNGIKFRREFPIDSYVVDFACLELNLVVELDGSQHIGDPNDTTRNDFMSQRGWSIARFPSAHALSQRDAILDTLATMANGQITGPVSSPEFQYYTAMPQFTTQDTIHMRRAIALTRPGRTWPNPSVGCAIVKDDTVIAEGTTGDGGRPHAEEIALVSADAAGATAYVTLEPCGHRSTGAPSCSQRLIDAGVARVVYACDDPSPFASHAGPERMKAAGIEVQSGLLADEAQPLIAPTAHFHTTGRPLIQASATADGFDADFKPESADLAAELSRWAATGYRHLRVQPGSELAIRLAALGYLTE